MRRHLVWIAALALAGCAQRAPEAATEADSETIPLLPYACEDGRTLMVAYPASGAARVMLDGNTYQLKLAAAGRGERYLGDGVQWWVKDSEAQLGRMREGEEIAADPGVACAPAKGGTAAPGPEAAAAVVETYYVLLETGRTDDAAKLRLDGQADDVTRLDTLHANIGKPEPVQQTPGASYVRTPVVIYGRLAEGGNFSRAGKVLASRSKGARAWRIERIDLSP